MKAVKVSLPTDLKSVEIYTFSDLHLGDRHCKTKEILAAIEAVRKKPNAYVILNGDILNNATTQSVSDTYSEALSPMEQLRKAVDMFAPIKDRILAITTGNHENRTYRTDGIDLTEILAIELGLKDRYSPESMVLFLRVGDKVRKTHKNQQVCYVFYITHGSGGGRREGSKVNRLVDLAGIIDADIYIHSHTHTPIVLKQAFYRTDVYNSTFAEVEKLFVNTNAWLSYGGYGEAQNYKPASTKAPVIYLSGSRKEFDAKV